ncbi:cellulase family glycosylhydrolase [Streptomyces griseoviridis]|uniref:Endo-1,4-beta-mannosidase n=1 Tax=Streptomyces griseoviridis TaxID=45398 RepID=A0ABT9L7L6_STRGD|nr:cellulase family glycosylhydrolase [Streptomyces griseoviridis]MDP9679697.1 endo-1,4-beta-mannosidase [Streptomyces griseoviridis]GGS99351.1 mannan endo-1,4-beta-mannosidase [Streptomyces griseoviridis]
MRRHSAHLTHDPAVLPWLGANFWSRTGGPLMWRDYDPKTVREELAVLREHGLTMTRSFFYWPDFHPEPHRVDETLCDRFEDFLDAHTETGMGTVPTFIVGHMSGENWDPVWRGGRDLYEDVWMVGRQAWFASRMTRRFKDHPAVTGWLITNEMPGYGRVYQENPPSSDVVTAWAQAMCNAVRAAGATQPVSLGDGAWGIEVTGRDNGFSLRDTAEYVDFVGPHVYRSDTDVPRQHHRAAFECELAAVTGQPVVLEEFGLSTDTVSAENAAVYYRQTLHTSLLGGATGWIAWNNTDYDDLWDRSPYDHHPFEMHFGITDRTGAPKAPLRELAAFADVLKAVDFARCRRAGTDAALVVPAFLERGYPYSRPADRPLIFTSLHQAYVAARAADLPAGLLREADGLPGEARLYLLPSTRQLTARTRRELARRAAGGATVYLSFCSGEHPGTRGPWFDDLDGLFGVELRLSYGVAEPIRDDVLEMTFTEDFGPLAAGETLTFPVAGNEDSRAFLPVVPRGARVVAVDGHGRPALLVNETGRGRTVLATYPLEHMAARTARVNPEQTHRLYAALADLAGAARPVTVGSPYVGADLLEHEDGRRFVWLVSQSSEELTVRPEVAGVLRDLATGAPVAEVRLAPYGVAVLELA